MKKTSLVLALTAVLFPAFTSAATSRNIHIEWSYSQPNDSRVLAGYNLYMAGVQVCNQSSAAATNLDCVVQANNGTFNFSLTSHCTDNSETNHSTIYPFTFTTSIEPPPVATITTSPVSLSGDAPFNVNFNGTGSTGNIASYNWSFDDGSASTGSSVGHQFTPPGTYTTTLTVTNS